MPTARLGGRSELTLINQVSRSVHQHYSIAQHSGPLAAVKPARDDTFADYAGRALLPFLLPLFSGRKRASWDAEAATDARSVTVPGTLAGTAGETAGGETHATP
jgi:hypothetical protein